MPVTKALLTLEVKAAEFLVATSRNETVYVLRSYDVKNLILVRLPKPCISKRRHAKQFYIPATKGNHQVVCRDCH